MNVLNELERFMSSEEELDSKAKDAKECQDIINAMKEKNIDSIDDEKIGEILDQLHIDSDRFSQLLPIIQKKMVG